MSRSRALIASILVIGLLPGRASAQSDPEEGLPFEPGPGVMKLGDRATVEISGHDLFGDGSLTEFLLSQDGSAPQGEVLGMVVPAEHDEWALFFEFHDVGYVSDDDQDEIDAEALLQSYVEGTRAGNEERRRRGFDTLHVTGWFLEPAYDPDTNDLTWAVAAETGSGERLINYDLRILGRDGYTSVTLATDPAAFELTRPEMMRILDSFEYVEGSRYAEFVEGDKLAGFGVAALIGGGAAVAASKVGFFAALGVFLKKAGKFIAVGAAALIAAGRKLLARLFGRNPSDPTA